MAFSLLAQRGAVKVTRVRWLEYRFRKSSYCRASSWLSVDPCLVKISDSLSTLWTLQWLQSTPPNRNLQLITYSWQSRRSRQSWCPPPLRPSLWGPSLWTWKLSKAWAPLEDLLKTQRSRMFQSSELLLDLSRTKLGNWTTSLNTRLTILWRYQVSK